MLSSHTWQSIEIQDFAKPYFHTYWTEIHDVTTIWKRNVCSFIVTLNAFNVRPTWHGRCPGDTPIQPSQTCLAWRSQLRCWCALAILVVSLEVVGHKHCPWRNPTQRNHTLSGLKLTKSSDNLYATCTLDNTDYHERLLLHKSYQSSDCKVTIISSEQS